MTEFKYVKELLSSFGEVFQKPILMLPFVYIFVISTIFYFITPQQYLTADMLSIDYNAIALIIGFAIIQGILGLAFRGMGLIGLRDYVNEEEVTVRKQTVGGLAIFWKVILLALLQMIIVAIPVVVFLAIFFGVSALSQVAGQIVGVLLILAFIVFVIFAIFYLLFANIIVSYEGKNAKTALQDSFNYARQNASHTILTLVTLVVSIIILIIILMILSIPFLFVSGALDALEQIIIGLITVPVSAAMLLFLFKAFNNGNGSEAKSSVNKINDKQNKELNLVHEDAAKAGAVHKTAHAKNTKANSTKKK